MERSVRSRARATTLTQDGDPVALLRSQIRQAHRHLDAEVVAARQRTQSRPEVQADVLSLYAHTLCVEDITINVLLGTRPPLFEQAWTGGQLVPWDSPAGLGMPETTWVMNRFIVREIAKTCGELAAKPAASVNGAAPASMHRA